LGEANKCRCVVCGEIYETEGVYFDADNVCEFCLKDRADEVEAYKMARREERGELNVDYELMNEMHDRDEAEVEAIIRDAEEDYFAGEECYYCDGWSLNGDAPGAACPVCGRILM